MKKLVYLECPTGIAGDMCLGALVDGGVPLDYLIEMLACLGISEEYQLRSQRVLRNSQQATQVQVDLNCDRSPSNAPHSHHPRHSHPHPHSHAADGDRSQHQHSAPTTQRSQHSPDAMPARHLPEIERLIRSAELPDRVKAWSLAIFRQLAVAEGAVHGIAPEAVHFHEVGATDAIVDIVGTCLGLDWLGMEQLYCSPLPTGGGTICAAHGQLPVPAPAVLKLLQLRQVPLYSNGINRELVTPTGAAIATTLACRFGPPPTMTLQQIGLGAGSCDLPLPNILRLWIGEGEGMSESSPPFQTAIFNPSPATAQDKPSPAPIPRTTFTPPATLGGLETVAVLETQIDDLNPQAIGYIFEILFAAGALDVFTQAIGMKKSRPGILLAVLCPPERIAACETILFQETTTLGIRRRIQQRTILNRRIESVETPYGPVRVKIAWAGDKDGSRTGPISNVQPEYEDCAQLARQQQISWRDVHQLALQAWHLEHGGNGKRLD